MAKASMKAREERRRRTALRFASKRAALKEIIKSEEKGPSEIASRVIQFNRYTALNELFLKRRKRQKNRLRGRVKPF